MENACKTRKQRCQVHSYTGLEPKEMFLIEK